MVVVFYLKTYTCIQCTIVYDAQKKKMKIIACFWKAYFFIGILLFASLCVCVFCCCCCGGGGGTFFLFFISVFFSFFVLFFLFLFFSFVCLFVCVFVCFFLSLSFFFGGGGGGGSITCIHVLYLYKIALPFSQQSVCLLFLTEKPVPARVLI